MEQNCYKLNRYRNKYADLQSFLEKFISEITQFGSSEQSNKIFLLSMEMLKGCHTSCKNLLRDCGNSNVQRVIDDIYEYACGQLQLVGTSYGRKKELSKMRSYVEPEEKSIGFRWELITDKLTNESRRQKIQSTYYYVPIIKQLESLFSDSMFCRVYMNFNKNKNHTCTEGIFKDGCCGNMYKTNSFYSNNPLAIQLQIFTDDFEPCDALKSKAGIHKITAFYLQIRNLPREYLSRKSSIYLVALCNSNDLKKEFTGINNILELIVSEIKMLETVGIKNVDNLELKAGLFNCIFDNLGANVTLGLSEGFNANFYCRFCVTKKEMCQKLTSEDASTLRTIAKYNKIVSKIGKCSSNLTQSQGVKTYCVLNDLVSFHMLSNKSVDIMHDLLEGIVPFLLNNIFKYCAEKKILSTENLIDRILHFNYGIQNKSNTPRKIHLDKKNLNLSAAQARCLFLHIPYILHNCRSELLPIWTTFETLSGIMQIVFSDNIHETDLNRLKSLTTHHLSSIIDIFNINLLPKHHFLTHYPTVIREMGPVILTWAMRMESKHSFFKDIIQSTKNFININKTLAYRHQEAQALNEFVYTDKKIASKVKIPFSSNNDYCIYINGLSKITDIEDIQTVKSVEINGVKYKHGLLIKADNIFYEIEHILTRETHFWILCQNLYEIDRYDQFYNSLIIKKHPNSIRIFSLGTLQNKKCFEKIFVDNEIHVIAYNLELYNMHNNY